MNVPRFSTSKQDAWTVLPGGGIGKKCERPVYSVTPVSPAERQQIISYFSQLSHAEDPQLRSLALQRLGEWGQGDHVRIAGSDALCDKLKLYRMIS